MRNNKVSPSPSESSPDGQSASSNASSDRISTEETKGSARMSLMERFRALFKRDNSYVSKHGYLEVHHVQKSTFGRQSPSRGDSSDVSKHGYLEVHHVQKSAFGRQSPSRERKERAPKPVPRRRFRKNNKVAPEPTNVKLLTLDDKTKPEILKIVREELSKEEFKSINQNFAQQTGERQRLERKFTRLFRENNRQVEELRLTMEEKSGKQSKKINKVRNQIKGQTERHNMDHFEITTRENEIREEIYALRKKVLQTEEKLQALLDKKKDREVKCTSSAPVDKTHGRQRKANFKSVPLEMDSKVNEKTYMVDRSASGDNCASTSSSDKSNTKIAEKTDSNAKAEKKELVDKYGRPCYMKNGTTYLKDKQWPERTYIITCCDDEDSDGEDTCELISDTYTNRITA